MSQKPNILTIIPARGGSKRLPGKNIKELNGKPLMAYSIEYAQKHIKGDLVVSTDDEKIAQIAQQYGVEVLIRPAHLAQDDTSTTDVLSQVLLSAEKEYDFVVLLQPTNPLRPENLFQEAWSLLQKEGESSLLTVSLNQHKLGKIKGNHFRPHTYQFGQRSQDLEPLYYENGLLYIAAASLAKSGVLMDENSIAMPIDHPYATVDIDDETDWQWAEFLIQKEQ
ncbi:MAG: acylneuraminate cytidylyltransferase family protein [Chitinophagales bacterium]|nr:acylneuraminate cytidylyltransferase family protein [Chitinophagales bacterium]